MNKYINILTVLFIIFIATIIISVNLNIPFAPVEMAKDLPYGDKIGHFSLIGILTLLVNLVLKNRKTTIWNKQLLTGSLAIFIFITIEEFSQIFIDNRTFDLIDLSANYLGILFFSWLVLKIKR